MNHINYNSKNYKRSRKAYMAQCTFEYFISLLVADAFLAKLLKHIGISDALTGIISSFITLAFIIQLCSIFVVKLKVSTKKLVIVSDTISIVFFMLLYFIPFLPESMNALKPALIVIGVLIAYAGKYLILSIAFKWGNSFVAPGGRAIFSAKKEIVSLASGIIFTLVIGAVVDHFESVKNVEGGFLFIASVMLVVNILNFISYLLISKEDESMHEADSIPMRIVFKETMGNKNFRNIVYLTILFDCARYVLVGYMGLFKNELLPSLFFVQAINMLGNFARMFVSVPFGRYSDKKSFAKGFELGLWILAISYICIIFTTDESWWLIIGYTIVSAVSTAGTNANSFNITYNYVSSAYITQAMAFKNSIGGICGFIATLFASRIVNLADANNYINIFGINLYSQQILATIGLVLIGIAILFLRIKIAKQKIMKQ